MDVIVVVNHENKLEGVFDSLRKALNHLDALYAAPSWRVENHYLPTLKLHTYIVYAKDEADVLMNSYILSTVTI